MSISFERLPKVIARTGLGRSSIYALMKEGNFPKSILLNSRAVGWKSSDIDDWIENRIKLQSNKA